MSDWKIWEILRYGGYNVDDNLKIEINALVDVDDIRPVEISGSEVMNIMLDYFGNRYYLFHEYDNPGSDKSEESADARDCFNKLKSRFNNWKLSNINEWNRIFGAMLVEYSPAYNYDKYGKVDTTEGGSDSTSGSNSSTTTSSGNTSNTLTKSGSEKVSRSEHGGYTDTVDNYKLGYETDQDNDVKVESRESRKHTPDSNYHEDADTTFNNRQDSNVGTSSGSVGVVGSDSNTTNYGKTIGVESHEYGNMGIQTAADIIGGELKLRSYHVYIAIVKEFLDSCSYY